jgi:hypothetical protein
MSEVQSRPAASRGRGSARGGRGSFSSRGGRGGRSHTTNGDKPDTTAASIEDDGEVGQLKKQYGGRVATIKEMFPDWTDEDIVFALQETNGDLETTVDRITDGMYCPLDPATQLGSPYCAYTSRSRADNLRQDQSHNGERFRRRRRTGLDPRLRTPPSPHLAIQPKKGRFLVLVELALRAVEDAAAALNEAEAGEAVERRPHIPTARARRTQSPLCLPLNQMHGVQLLPRKNSPPATPGAPLQLIHHLQPRLKWHRALFQMASRRVGQACLPHLRQHQKRHRLRLRSNSKLHP